MKHKKLLLTLIVAALVLAFSTISLGAGKNNEQTYIGTWEHIYTNYNYFEKMILYPCHFGEVISNGTRNDKKVDLKHTFSWEVENGYLKITTDYGDFECYISNDGGNTLKRVTAAETKSISFSKVK